MAPRDPFRTGDGHEPEGGHGEGAGSQDAGREPRRGEEERPRPSRRYSTFVGLVFLGFIGYVTYNTLSDEREAILGTEAVRGKPLPEFAVPDVLGSVDADANIAQDDCETADNPCPEDARRTPACEIEIEDAYRVCDFFDRPLVLSFWFTDPSGCPPTQDIVDDAARRFGDRVNFLSIAVRGDRKEIREIVSERGWEMPVGWDRDGAVSNIYRVGVCPTIAFAYPGGIFHSASIEGDELTEAELEAEIEQLVRAADRREEAAASRREAPAGARRS